MKVRYITHLSKLDGLTEEERRRLEPVADRYVFRLNDYYCNLINWDDPDDPLRRLVVPLESELNDWGELDASHEADYTPVRGCQHKYSDTALLLVNEVCGAYCRYCFRKRLFMNDNDDATLDYAPGLAYIAEHEEITNVLLTGGDPLIMSARRLGAIMSDVAAVPHVRIIRIGTKMTAFNPYRVLDDPDLLEMVKEFCESGTRIYFMNHFDHPRELTPEAREAVKLLRQAGGMTVNQCPIVRGVNDNWQTFASLFRELSFVGCPQYYVFQGRPTAGNEPYEVPIVEGMHIFLEANRHVSGLAKRARFSMSHRTGKIEIFGVDERYIYMRYHRAHRKEDYGQMVVALRDDKAYWLDQLTVVSGPQSAIESAAGYEPYHW
ncbi:MAG: KamA family radical SAM protein [Gemmatimonadales bacterium]|nr:KamA family radical SAM protein [Gemmatimonadales bacterium]NIN10810.1 KamA family radical SAM protein [Gemmatimonadales bacterium]NIN49453.1 KamA family radical SAM protein [Gemmatimonadales bacterium]NIP06917.1 KamA family radical SAM protein [Gemmatimonadales bacterium]NIR02853.1 KamA family radical SAM protein [Gemmatimonadales bacterium]